MFAAAFAARNGSAASRRAIAICDGLLVAGAMAVIRYARQHGTKRAWLTRIMDRRPAKVAAVALAKKADLEMPRDAWAEIHGDAAPEPMKSACTRGRCGLEQRLCGLAVTRLAIS